VSWIWDKDHITLYHGTHKDNVKHIKKSGLNRPDPTTGMISLTPDPSTAHGYAAMSGEHNFRRAGGKAFTVDHADRRVLKFRIPKKWIHDNMDKSLSGNMGMAAGRINPENKQAYSDWRKKNPTHKPHSYYAMTEIRVSKHVPSEFLQKVLKKKNG
jgi:hypothetical protein